MKIKQILKKFLPMIIIVLIAFLLIIWLLSMKKSPTRNNGNNILSAVPTMEVVVENLQLKIPVIGELTAQKHVVLYSEVQGILENSQKQFLEGISYNKGEVLLSIDSKNAEYNLLTARSGFLTKIAQMLPQFKFEFPESEEQWSKYLEDFNIDSKINPLPEPKSTREKNYIAIQGLSQTYYEIKNLENTLSKYQIKAPFDGKVILSNIKPGTLVRAGQILGEYVSTDIYDLETSVTVEQAALIKIGDKVTLKSSNENKIFEGTVTRINGIVDTETLMINIYITVKGTKLREGMYLSGEINSSSIVSGTEVPRRIITNSNTVFIVEDNTIKELPINIVAVNGDTAIITGLENGTILSTKSQNVYDGQKVTIL